MCVETERGISEHHMKKRCHTHGNYKAREIGSELSCIWGMQHRTRAPWVRMRMQAALDGNANCHWFSSVSLCNTLRPNIPDVVHPCSHHGASNAILIDHT